MQDVDRVTHVEGLAQPSRAQRVPVEIQPRALVPISQRLDGAVRDQRWRQNVRQRSSVRSPETQLAVRLSFDLISLLMDRAVVATTGRSAAGSRRHRGSDGVGFLNAARCHVIRRGLKRRKKADSNNNDATPSASLGAEVKGQLMETR